MPPRFAYWTIIAGGLPTSFRAAEKDELMPTFRRLKEKHPDAEMKYFARGKLWASPEEARRSGQTAEAGTERRGRDWRPGGEHRDPRQRFKDAKKERNQDRRQQRWEAKRDRPAPKVRPHGDPLAPRPDRRTGVEGSRQGRPASNRPQSNTTRRPQNRSFGKAYRPAGQSGRPRTEKRPHTAARTADREKQTRGFRPSQRRFERNQDAPQRPPDPQREPPPGREPVTPEPPPRPSEPMIKPPGPPERGTAPRDRGGPRRDRKE